MNEVIIADRSCLIVFTNIGEFELLQRLFGTITITRSVALEFGGPLPEWVHQLDPVNRHSVEQLLKRLDQGEATSIALAMESMDPLLILDERAARAVAQERGLRFIGTLGLLTLAKRRGLIPKVTPFLARLQQVGFRMSASVVSAWLLENKE